MEAETCLRQSSICCAICYDTVTIYSISCYLTNGLRQYPLESLMLSTGLGWGVGLYIGCEKTSKLPHDARIGRKHDRAATVTIEMQE